MKTNSMAKQNELAKTHKPLKELNLCDDFLFNVVTEDLQTCKDILEMILGREIRAIYHKEAQKVIHNLPGDRGIRLDFYAEDMDGSLFDVEMQKENVGNIPKRTRFYQALMDSPLLKSGEANFDRLNPTYIIVICNFDLYDRGRYQYIFENQCHEVTGLKLGDGCQKIILNTQGHNEEETDPTLVEFLHYIRDSSERNVHSDSDEKLKRLHRKICEIKNSDQMEVAYMKMEERDRLIREEGNAEGIRRYNSLIIKLSEEGQLDLLPKAAADPDFLNKLYEKYGI